MGVERMGGSNPDFGMAEPESSIVHDHDELKHLNCILTRAHWPQDDRVLEYCDRHGILVQSEIPAWGWETFKGTATEPDPDILENGLEQMREMIARTAITPALSFGVFATKSAASVLPPFNSPNACSPK